MPAHVKSSMFGCSLTVPITSGRLALGTWQGALCIGVLSKALLTRLLGCHCM